MVSRTSLVERLRPDLSARWATVVVATTAAMVGVCAVSGTANAAPADQARAAAVAPDGAPCARAATFTTEIQWGGPDAPWHPDTDLTLLISNRHDVVTMGGVAVGTQVTWSAPGGNGSVVFFGEGDFSGSAQFPDEGPVGYRGTLKQHSGKLACAKAATYATRIQWGGFDAPWHPDTDLTLLISNRHEVISRGTAQTGTQVSWSGPNGKANIMVDSEFSGSAQFPDEGPVGYRGTLRTGK